MNIGYQMSEGKIIPIQFKSSIWYSFSSPNVFDSKWFGGLFGLSYLDFQCLKRFSLSLEDILPVWFDPSARIVLFL